MPNWIETKSSLIQAVVYDQDTNTLFVKFKRSDSIYRYLAVPEALIKEMLEAESIGQYFTQKIKGKFHFSREESNGDKQGISDQR